MAQAEFLIREWMRSTTVLRVYSNKFSITTDDFFFFLYILGITYCSFSYFRRPVLEIGISYDWQAACCL